MFHIPSPSSQPAGATKRAKSAEQGETGNEAAQGLAVLWEAAERPINGFISGAAVVGMEEVGKRERGGNDGEQATAAVASVASGSRKESQSNSSMEEAADGQGIEGDRLWAALRSLPFLALSHTSGSDRQGRAGEMCVNSAERLLQLLRGGALTAAPLGSSRTSALQCLLSSALESLTALASECTSDGSTGSIITVGGNRSLQPQALLPLFWSAVKEQSASPLVLAAAAEFLQRFGATPHSSAHMLLPPPPPPPSLVTGSLQSSPLHSPSWDDMLPSLLPALTHPSLAARTAALQLLPLLHVGREGEEGEGGEGRGEGGMSAGATGQRSWSEESEEPVCLPWSEVIEVSSGVMPGVLPVGSVQVMTGALKSDSNTDSVRSVKVQCSSLKVRCREPVDQGKRQLASLSLTCMHGEQGTCRLCCPDLAESFFPPPL